MEQDLEQSFRQSFWTRSFPINPLYVLGVVVVIAVYVVLPVYLYTERLKSVCCDPDKGTQLACNATEDALGPQGAPDDVTGSLRKLLAVDQIGSQVLRSSSELVAGAVDGVGGGDPWAHHIALG